MRKKSLFVILTWLVAAVAVLVLYLLRGVPLVKEILVWALGIWPIFAVLGGIALIISVQIIGRQNLSFNKSTYLPILVSLIATIVLLLIVEVAFRLSTPFPGTIATYEQNRDYMYFHKPDSTGWEVSPVGEFPPIKLKYNKYGFRNPDFPIEKDSQLRVVMLGDSFIESRQVPYEKTASAILQEKLASSTGKPETLVINAGISAYTTTTEFLLLKYQISQFKPDIIVVFFAFNDYTDNYQYKQYVNHPDFDTKGLPAELMPEAYSKLALRSPSVWLDRHSALFHFFQLQKTIRATRAQSNQVVKLIASGKLLTESPRAIFKDEFTPDEQRLIDFTHYGISRIKELCDQSNIKLVYAIIPFPAQVNALEWAAGKATWGYAKDEVITSTRYQDLLKGFLEANHIQYIDLLPYFKEAGKTERLFLNYDGHWNANGNRIAAEAPFESIMKLIKPR